MTAEAEFPIDAQGIARRFGARWSLRGVTLQVRPGEIVSLTGANGTGKTTWDFSRTPPAYTTTSRQAKMFASPRT
jgi:ABC-type branched-subunit amino acid transport system ATPase component